MKLKNKKWEVIKDYLFAIDKMLKEEHGLSYCKTCGVDFTKLVKDIEEIFENK